MQYKAKVIGFSHIYDIEIIWINKELIASHLFMEGLDGCVVAWHCLSAGVYWTTCVNQCQTITFFWCTKFIGQCKWVTLLQYSLDWTDNTFYGNYGNHVHSTGGSLFLIFFFFFQKLNWTKVQFSFCPLSVCLSVRMFDNISHIITITWCLVYM